jgi:hypothetical protein
MAEVNVKKGQQAGKEGEGSKSVATREEQTEVSRREWMPSVFSFTPLRCGMSLQRNLIPSLSPKFWTWPLLMPVSSLVSTFGSRFVRSRAKGSVAALKGISGYDPPSDSRLHYQISLLK